MNNISKISVIISIYNGERYLREAIDSILNQSLKDFEFIIVNDASTDRTLDILKNYADKDKRIILVNNNENLGLTESLNKAIKLAKGEYIARMDADDISHPDRLGFECDFLDNNPDIGLVGTHASFINEKGQEFSIWHMPTSDYEIKKELMLGNSFCHGSIMIRKKCLEKIGHYREKFKYAQDYDLWLRCSEHYKCANLPLVLYKLRRFANSISRKKLSKQSEYHLLAICLARERRNAGIDRLNEIEGKDIVSLLIKNYGLNMSRINKFKSDNFMNYSLELLNSKSYFQAIRLWVKGFLLDPESLKSKIFFKELTKNLGYR